MENSRGNFLTDGGGVSTAAEAESARVRACGGRARSTEVRLLIECVPSELFLCKH